MHAGADLSHANHDTQLPNPSQMKVSELLVWMRDNMVKERPELFMKGNSV